MIVRSVIVICLNIAVGWALTSCGKSEEANKKKTDWDTQKLMTTLGKPDQEAVAPLSQKYDLQPDLIESFLDRYLTETNMGYRLIKESLKPSNSEASKPNTTELLHLEKENYFQALVRASQAVGITTKTAALLVSDYKMFTQRNNDNE
jgi:hypothetical protein